MIREVVTLKRPIRHIFVLDIPGTAPSYHARIDQLHAEMLPWLEANITEGYWSFCYGRYRPTLKTKIEWHRVDMRETLMRAAMVEQAPAFASTISTHALLSVHLVRTRDAAKFRLMFS